MRIKKNVLLLVLFLGAVAALTAEVALDEVIQAGRFSFYRDHADPHKYYYIPDEPRLATKRDGTPEFTLIKFSKTDGTTKGGILHFLVTWGYTSGELSSAQSVLQSKDPEAKIAGPVPFKEGTFLVESATAGEGGIFNRRIVGEGKAPIMPGQKAAVSIALTQEGASFLWESFKNPTSDISVRYILKFTGVTPAFQAKLKVDWDKVYTQHDVKLHAEGTIKVVKIAADVRAILEELRQSGAIQLDVVGENENMQKMLDAAYNHILSLMCEKVPMGTGTAPSPPAKKSPLPAFSADWPGDQPLQSMSVLADLVRLTEERLRGGPFSDQQQESWIDRPQNPPCDAAAKLRAIGYFGDAMRLMGEKIFERAAELFQQAYAACPLPIYLYWTAHCYDQVYSFPEANTYYQKFIAAMGSEGSESPDLWKQAKLRIAQIASSEGILAAGRALYNQENYADAAKLFEKHFELTGAPQSLVNAGSCYEKIGYYGEGLDAYKQALELFKKAQDALFATKYYLLNETTLGTTARNAQSMIDFVEAAMAERAQAPPAQAAATQPSLEAKRKADRQQAQSQTTGQRPRDKTQAQEQTQTTQTQAGAAGQQTTSTGTPTGGARPPVTQTGAAPPAAGGQAQQQTAAQPGAKPAAGQTPPAKPGAKPGAKPQAKPGTKPEAAIKPIVSVELGYSFKRIKLSGKYEVDMRKRLREDREMPMSGNISGVYQKYGEDPRFFTVISLDDPTFQERSVEVILDGQDASDFKGYVNSVSVLFRKQRFSGAPMTGEVKFFDEQFAQSGNRLSFKYGRLNEASTEWLDYEYKPKWSFYGGVEWEGQWTKTSDSVLTLTPPVRRRKLEISVDEDNILKNNVKALAVQVRHQIYGKDVLKEVVINYDKGDPLQAEYTYMHEEGKLGYSYKVVWLFLDGREIQTDWTAKESPFIYAVYAKR